MAPKSTPKAKAKLTDADRHKRFVAMAKEVGASDDAKALDQALKKVTSGKPQRRKDA